MAIDVTDEQTPASNGRATRMTPSGTTSKAASAPTHLIRYAKIHGAGHRPWLTAMLTWRPTKVAAIALANKLARMA
ncbi:hypothetical protein BJS_03377 [Bradyrhizobium japonicum SEMIA 5079]|nr:hypothetical protein BJS_03377 [Bradyrhizobium japonicum SEMIA 5079]